MKKILLLLALAFAFNSMYAQPPAGPANIGDSYGEKINEKGAISTAQLHKKLSAKDTVEAKITGKVLSSCPKKGCWMNVELADKSQVFVKFKDYAFFVPMDIVGKNIVLDGQATTKMTSVEELKHYAEDAKKTKEEVDAITKPEKQVRFLADGVLVVKQPGK